jgi:ferredoxin
MVTAGFDSSAVEVRREKVRVSVDQDRCVASGQCVLAAADVFDQRDEDGIVVLRTALVDPSRAEDVRRAAGLCPAMAITVDD